MVECKVETLQPLDGSKTKDLVLTEDLIARGNAFLERISSVAPVPELPFSSDSTVFVFVPVYREFENIERLYKSWCCQKLPEGLGAEVVFFVNNTQDAPSDVKADNQKTYDYLISEISKVDKDRKVGLHVVDRFSGDNALPDGTTIGDIRNVAVSPFVKRATATGKNFVVLSADADSFPSENVAESLQRLMNGKTNIYGVIDRELEYTGDMLPEEQKIIEKLFLIQASEAVLLDYLSYGKWTSPVTTPGSGTFFTIGDFITVGGYESSLATGEDLDLGHKLSMVADDFVALGECTLVNLQRYSDRVDGDGNLFQGVKDKGYKVSSHAQLTVAHAKLRKWLVSSLVTKDNIADGVVNRTLSYARVAEILYGLGFEDIGGIFDTSGGSLEDVYDGIFENAVSRLYTREYDVDESLRSFDDLILGILGKDEKFIEIMKKLDTKGVEREHVVQTALQLFVLNSKSDINP